jgi:lipid II:glycine glycyltransferase (peptidoglycan interpeptide bridge formation enzyme)
VPFADHCEPLLGEDGDLLEFMSHLRAECDRRHWKYVELRPLSGIQEQRLDLEPSGSYWAHELDTRPSLESIANGLHRNCFRRKIRRAESENLLYETGTSQALVDEFYRLMLTTRRRHQLLPQPRRWFHNLVSCLGDGVQIRMARKDGFPIAALLTLRHQARVVYKYGCSDKRFHKVGGMPFLFWKLIEDCKASGIDSIDLGRTDLTNEGLLTFKNRMGAAKKPLTYYRYTNLKMRKMPNWKSRDFGSLFSILPDAVLSNAGGLVYRHIG